MDKGLCQKCGGKDILTHQPGFLSRERDFMRIGGVLWWRTVAVTTRVCTDCGFMENYADPESLPALKQRLIASRHPLEE
jgi:hypothetical protein